MINVTQEELLNAGVHFGHLKAQVESEDGSRTSSWSAMAFISSI
jgi:ribosomal protein S2